MMSMSLDQARDGQGIVVSGAICISPAQALHASCRHNLGTEQLAGTHLYAERIREALVWVDVGR